MKKIIIIFYTCFFTFYASNAFAYIDPGTGGILIQALLAAFAAISTFFAFYWKKVKDFINKI